jgi:hypothetical protein
MPESEAPKDSLITLGTLKSVFDASWKVLPLLWFAFQFYSNQATLAKTVASNREIIGKMETELNRLDREVTKNSAAVEGLKQIQDNDRQFFLETHPKPRR